LESVWARQHLLAAAYTAQGRSEQAAIVSGTGLALWGTVGHPQHGTPELAPVRGEAERRARAALSDHSCALTRDRGNGDVAAGLQLAYQDPPRTQG
jgi:hypothetical protein